MKTTTDLTASDTALARRLVADALVGRPDEVVETALLCTSELVTNAFVHGATAAHLAIEIDGERLRVDVEDDGPMTDIAPIYVVAHSEHGRGLVVVDTLATAWGVERRTGGKAVFFELDLTRSS